MMDAAAPSADRSRPDRCLSASMHLALLRDDIDTGDRCNPSRIAPPCQMADTVEVVLLRFDLPMNERLGPA